VIKGFSYIIFCTQLQTGNDITVLIIATEYYNRNTLFDFNSIADFKTAYTGEVNVEKNEINMFFINQLQALFSCNRGDNRKTFIDKKKFQNCD